MSNAKQSGGIEPSKAQALASVVEYGEGAVVSRTLHKGRGGTLTVFAFDVGQGLSEHSAPFDAYVQILDGAATLTIGGERVDARTGDIVLMPANIPHALHAPEPFKMLLTMIKELA